jgi:hypothetical protein
VFAINARKGEPGVFVHVGASEIVLPAFSELVKVAENEFEYVPPAKVQATPVLLPPYSYAATMSGERGEKEGRFVTLDDGNVIFLGGPGAGGGTGQAALVGSAQGNPVYIGTGIPDAITVEGKGALLMVGDRQILSCVPNRHGMFFHATAWEAAGKPHDPGYDTSTRLTLGEATSKGRSLITGNFELGMGDYPTLEAQFNRLSTVAVRLIRAGLPEDTLLILSGNPSDKPGGISMPLSSWSAGKKEGRFVTIDDRPVFIGGPGSGGGSAAASGSGAPAGEPLQPLTPEAIDSGIDEVSKMTPKELYQTADTLYNDMLGEDWISADYEEADAKRQAAARALAEKYGLDADQTIAVSNTWVSTACDDNPLALGVQLAVAERLGLEPNAYLQEKLTTVTPAKVDPRIIDAFYTETQAQLAAAGVGPRMVLSRGIIVDRATAKRGWMTAELNPLSSFSTGGDDGLDKAFRFAQSFGDANSIGVIVQANIPTSRIIGWGFSGLGQIDEGEFIVAGGRAHLSIRQVVEGGP